VETGKGTWGEKRLCRDTPRQGHTPIIPQQLVCFQNKRVSIGKDELKSTSKAIETVHNLCCNENKGASELVAELSTLYQCIR
jgi:hypothetical protein